MTKDEMRELLLFTISERKKTEENKIRACIGWLRRQADDAERYLDEDVDLGTGACTTMETLREALGRHKELRYMERFLAPER